MPHSLSQRLSRQLSRRNLLLRSGHALAVALLAGCVPSQAAMTVTAATTGSGLGNTFLHPLPDPPMQATLLNPLLRPEPTLEQKIGQMLFLGFRGKVLTPESQIIQDIQQYNVGGAFLFAHNAQSSAQLKTLTNMLQQAAQTPLLIATDQEGGKVSRLGSPFGIATNFSAQYLGTQEPHVTWDQAENFGHSLHAVGINQNLAPVVDLNLNPRNPIIGGIERSFSADPGLVVTRALAFIRAHRQANVVCTLKHFPGHGSSQADTHLGFVDVSESWQPSELDPYRELLKAGECDVVMTAHIFNSKLDDKLPATLSQPIITGLLRKELGYGGLVISDDMQMKAISAYYSFDNAVQLAVQAGVDMLSISNFDSYQKDAVPRAIAAIRKLVDEGKIDAERINQSYQRIMRVKQLTIVN